MNAPSQSADRDEVMILSASVGAGHNSAARALAEALRRDGGPEARCLDVLDFTGRFFRAWYAGGYAWAVSHIPNAYGFGYHLSNWPRGPRAGLFERFRIWGDRRQLAGLRDLLRQRRPRVIVHTHFLAPMLTAWMRRRGELDAKIVVCVTDDVTHRCWFAHEVDRWFVASPSNCQTLRRWGVDEARIERSGIPVHPKWTDPVDNARVLADWRLPADRKIVLLSAGADFTCGPVVKIARGIAAADNACVVVLAGRNKQLAASVASVGLDENRLRAVSFTDKLHELASVASVMVTKPGGITTAECLAKALPMVLLKPVPGQEAGNARYFQSEGAALVARSASDAVASTLRLLADEPARAALAARCRSLHQNAASAVAAHVRSLLNP